MCGSGSVVCESKRCAGLETAGDYLNRTRCWLPEQNLGPSHSPGNIRRITSLAVRPTLELCARLF
jgi:hypothetical protein